MVVLEKIITTKWRIFKAFLKSCRFQQYWKKADSLQWHPGPLHTTDTGTWIIAAVCIVHICLEFWFTENMKKQNPYSLPPHEPQKPFFSSPFPIHQYSVFPSVSFSTIACWCVEQVFYQLLQLKNWRICPRKFFFARVSPGELPLADYKLC